MDIQYCRILHHEVNKRSRYKSWKTFLKLTFAEIKLSFLDRM
jgi:hypothetical protein